MRFAQRPFGGWRQITFLLTAALAIGVAAVTTWQTLTRPDQPNVHQVEQNPRQIRDSWSPDLMERSGHGDPMPGVEKN